MNTKIINTKILSIKNFFKGKINAFTNLNIILFILCYYRPKIYYISNISDIINNNTILIINYDFLYSICFCWTYLIFFTFNSAYIIDNTCFIRMAKKKNLSLKAFHIGNIILHFFPFIYVNIYLPNNINYLHSCLGSFTNLLWCYYASNKTFCMDNLYVKFKKDHTKKLYLINISSILYAPLCYNLNKYLTKTI